MIVVLMGVSGSGKTTVGHKLAADLGWEFLDGDDFHPPANKEKMGRGVPLTDADRDPWLAALAAELRARVGDGRRAVLACSALKQAYRDRLRVDASVRFVYLKGSPQLLRERLEERPGHFFKAELLTSQLETLEEPEGVLSVDIGATPDAITRHIERELGLAPPA